jgi:membrane-bound metal-dependent hydrolase YbcI (DUF457 family)
VPTPIAHALVGAGIYLAAYDRHARDNYVLAVGAVVSACFADTDFAMSVVAGRNIHHYFTHSLGFTALWALVFFAVAKWVRRDRPGWDAAVLGVAYLSHVLLDMLSKDTGAPYGVELFWPFSDSFHISPVLIFDEIWRGSLARLFGLHNWLAVAREVAIVGPFVALVWWLRGRDRNRRKLATG